MSLFFREPETEELTIEHADKLDVETKVLLINAVDLLNRVRREWHRRGVDIDLTLRMQLRQDTLQMEKAIKAVDSRMCTPEKIAALENMYLRLQAEAQAVLGFREK